MSDNYRGGSHHHRHHRHSSSFIKNKLPIILVIVAALVFAGMLYYYNLVDKQREAELKELAAQYKAEEEAEEAAYEALIEEIEATYSFYQKLAAGYDVQILIVGDSIGSGSGADSSEYQWFYLLQSYLNETYMDGSEYDGTVSITNVSMGGNTSYAGYVRTMVLDDDVDYDLAIICYGQNDSETDFALYYESIIRAIESKYEGCSIISILESSQQSYTNKMLTIQEICDHYGIPVADTIGAFNDSGYDYDELAGDGTHPNNEGQQIYYETIRDVIDDQVAADTGMMEAVSAYTSGVEVFDNFVWYAAGDYEDETEDESSEDSEEAETLEFTRVDETAFTLSVSASGILGIDYTYESGDNTADIYIDGELYTSPTVTFNYDFSQRHILVVSEDCTVDSEIKIVFETEEQADGFYGMCFSWAE